MKRSLYPSIKVKSENKLENLTKSSAVVLLYSTDTGCDISTYERVLFSMMGVLIVDWLVGNYGTRMGSRSIVGLYFPHREAGNTVTNSNRPQISNLLSDNLRIMLSLPTKRRKLTC